MILTNKVLLITGGTSGMAKATVSAALQAGASVGFVARRAAIGEQMVEDIAASGVDADRIAYYEGDVTDFDRMQEVVEQMVERFGRIDSLFCCAGTHIVGDVLSTSLEQWNQLRNLNTTHMFMAMKYVIPLMQQQGGGSIVLMGSDQTFVAKRKSSIYGASKAAIGQLTKSTALDFADDHIRVNCVCPGTIETPQAIHNAQKLAQKAFDGDVEAAKRELAKGQFISRWGKPEEVANLVCFLLSDQASFMTGSLVSIDGGYVGG